MKQALLIIILGLGVVALSACTLGPKSPAGENSELNGSLSMKQEGQEEVVENIPPAPLVDGNYQVDVNASILTWRGEKNLIGKAHTGTAPLRSGSLQILNGQLSGGEFIVDLNALKSDEAIEGLETHLKSADFFDVAAYPEAKLVITSVELGDDALSYKVKADLTIKGTTAPVSFSAALSQSANVLMAISEFEIDRTVWGLQYASGKFFQDLGDKVISDEIKFGVNLQARL
jgi:polyisoprenoid-binding protein YceI